MIEAIISVAASGTLVTRRMDYALVLTRKYLVVRTLDDSGDVRCINLARTYHPFMVCHRDVWNLKNLKQLLPDVDMRGAYVRDVMAVNRAG